MDHADKIIFDDKGIKSAIEDKIQRMKLRLTEILKLINCEVPFDISALVYDISINSEILKDLEPFYYVNSGFVDFYTYRKWWGDSRPIKGFTYYGSEKLDVQFSDNRETSLNGSHHIQSGKMQVMVVINQHDYNSLAFCEGIFKNLNIINHKGVRENLQFNTFLHYVIHWFIRSYENDLNNILRNNENIINFAGDGFIEELIIKFALGIRDRSIPWGSKGIYYVLNHLSSLKYETAETKSKIVIAPITNFTSLNLDIVFKERVFLSDYRKVRKLLEISRNDLLLISDSVYIYGYATLDTLKKLLYKNADYLICNILGNQRWNIERRNFDILSYNNVVLIEKSNYIYRYAKDNNNKSFLEVSIQSVIEDLSQVNLGMIYKIIDAAKENRHGTMIVFVEDAASEVKRLQSFAIPIEQTQTPEKIVQNITNIDGAVLYDFQGNCHAIGVILDGEVKPPKDEDINFNNKINISRGARHNSALNYFNTVKCKCFIVIVSEDGDITPLP